MCAGWRYGGRSLRQGNSQALPWPCQGTCVFRPDPSLSAAPSVCVCGVVAGVGVGGGCVCVRACVFALVGV